MKIHLVSALAISVTVLASALGACGPASATTTPTVAFEFAEVGSAGSTRHLYDQTGKPIDLIVASSIALTGTLTGIIPGGGKRELLVVRPPDADQFMLDISKQDSDKLREWTGQRIDREAVILVGDQVLTRATIRGALSGATALPIPSEIRSSDLKGAIEHARQHPR